MQKNVSELAENTFANMATWGIRAYLACSVILLLVFLIKITDNLFNQTVCMTLACCTGAALLLFVLGLFGLFALDKMGCSGKKRTRDNCIEYPGHKQR